MRCKNSEKFSSIIRDKTDVCINKLLHIPTPFRVSFQIQLKTNREEPVHLRIVDVSGKLLCEKEVVIQELETVYLGDGLSNGVYQVLITQANEAKMLRVVKY